MGGGGALEKTRRTEKSDGSPEHQENRTAYEEVVRRREDGGLQRASMWLNEEHKSSSRLRTVGEDQLLVTLEEVEYL